jgi:hypothetical protein
MIKDNVYLYPIIVWQVLLDRERSDRSAIDNQLREKNREIAELQSRYDAHSYELNAK